MCTLDLLGMHFRLLEPSVPSSLLSSLSPYQVSYLVGHLVGLAKVAYNVQQFVTHLQLHLCLGDQGHPHLSPSRQCRRTNRIWPSCFP